MIHYIKTKPYDKIQSLIKDMDKRCELAFDFSLDDKETNENRLKCADSIIDTLICIFDVIGDDRIPFGKQDKLIYINGVTEDRKVIIDLSFCMKIREVVTIPSDITRMDIGGLFVIANDIKSFVKDYISIAV